MPINQPANLVLTPVTWNEKKSHLVKTETKLLHLAGWYGSTHASATWRKDHDFLAAFQEENIYGFNPQLIGSWDPSYAVIEADVLATASVIVIRLENNELLNGSLGSIAEIGMALTSAALRGQIVVVSIEDDLLISLSESGAIAQYMILEMFLEHLEKIPGLTNLLRIHRGEDLSKLGQLACDAAKQQMAASQKAINFKDYLAKKERRNRNYPLRVLLGGSGGPYCEAYETSFRQKKQTLIAPYLAEGQIVKVLSEGAIADAWNIPYGSVDKLGVALATRALLSIEAEYKREADLLLLPIMAEAASKAAVTEIGLLLVNALATGQTVDIFLEPFNMINFIRYQLKEVDIKGCTTEKEKRMALRQAGVSDSILATAVQDEIEEASEIFCLLMGGASPAFNQIKQSLLGKTEIFHAADNIRRVRSLVQAHLERLIADERFPGFFSYATQIES